MSHKNKVCLKMQAKAVFDGMLAIGQSKHEAKQRANKDDRGMERQNNAIRDKIFSYSTYENYLKHIWYFLEYCERIGLKRLKDCQPHVGEWLQMRIDQGLSPRTIALEAAACGKLFQCPIGDFGVELPSRTRASITRSRKDCARDRHFSEERNRELINFCKCTGLRRDRELAKLRGDQLITSSSGKFYLRVQGKGGKWRDAPVIGTEEEIQAVVNRCRAAGHDLVWDHIHSAADVHSYRADYACALYKQYARPLEDIPRTDRYYCRSDMKGVILDKKAMKRVSLALGHSRISVIAQSYLYRL